MRPDELNYSARECESVAETFLVTFLVDTDHDVHQQIVHRVCSKRRVMLRVHTKPLCTLSTVLPKPQPERLFRTTQVHTHEKHKPLSPAIPLLHVGLTVVTKLIDICIVLVNMRHPLPPSPSRLHADGDGLHSGLRRARYHPGWFRGR